ncbi:GAF domain-containing protein [Dyadobacter sp.]|uniref:GAF domain-containing protein n=1 Tax=Dyadobacter sp. TaxID=1914288 RepID=UPI003F6F8712
MQADENHLALYNATDHGLCLIELIYENGKVADLIFREQNAAFGEHTGLGNVVGKRFSELPTRFETNWINIYSEVAETGEPLSNEVYLQDVGRWYKTKFALVGHVGSSWATAVTQQKRREANLTFLNELSAELEQLTSIGETLEVLGEKIGEHFGLSHCRFVELDHDNNTIIVNHAWQRAGTLEIRTPARISDFLTPEFNLKMSAGETVVIDDVFSNPLADGARFLSVGVGSLITVPLLRDGVWRFWLGLYHTAAHHWHREEVAFIKELAARIWIRLERARAEQALRISEARHRTLFDSVDDGVCLFERLPVRADGLRDYRYVAMNPAMQAMFGKVDLSGQSIRDNLPDEVEAWYDDYDRVLETGQSIRIERESEPQGMVLEVFVTRVEDGSGKMLLAVMQDVTERKKEEQRKEFVLAFSDELRALTDPLAIQNRTLQLLTGHFRLDRCWVSEVSEQQGFSTVGPEYFRPDLAPMSGVFQLADYPETMRQLMTQPMMIEDAPTDPRFSDSEKQLLNGLGLRSLLVVPLRRGPEHVIWALAATTTTPRRWTSNDRELLQDVAERTWTAVEQAKAETALRKNEEKYRALFESVDEGFSIVELVFGEAGQVVDFIYQENNPAFIKHVGVDLQGRKRSELLLDQKDFVLEKYDQLVRTGEPVHFEYCVQRLGGMWFQVAASRIGEQGSKYVGIVFRNVTERKRQEQEQALLLRLGDKIRPLTDPVMIEGEVTNVLRAHFGAGWCYYVQWDEVTKVGVVHRDATRKGLASLIGEHDVSDVPEFLDLLKANPLLNVSDYESYEMLTSKLRARYTSIGFRSMLIATLVKQGRLVASFLIGDDKIRQWSTHEETLLMQVAERTWAAVERAKAERELQRIEERQSAILGSATDYAIFTLDLDLRVLDWNAGAQFVLGYADQEILGQPGEIFFVPEDRANGAPEFERRAAIENGRVENERWHLRKDGSRFYGSGVTTPLLDEDGNLIGLLKVLRDLTVQKQGEDALKQADKRKDEFLAMLAHELRNPISTLRNAISVLKITHGIDTAASEIVGMMDKQATHLVRMIDDLLDVSRVTQGKIELKMERLELGPLVANAVKAIKPQFESRHKQLSLAVLTPELFAKADSTRLSQVVTNLLTNGLRYTEDDGHVWVSVFVENGYGAISIKDNGIGLSNEQQTSVFDLFVQGDNSLARTQGGLGIGLTLVKQLVEMHGGKVTAKSEGIGHGSDFWVYIPLLDFKEQNQTRTEENLAEKCSSRRILVIDDMEDLATLTAMLLRLKGYEVEISTNGKTGAELVEKLKPSIVLCDIGMPGMDGHQTATQIRQGQWGRGVTLIALSGYGLEEDKQKAKKAGFDGHITKPIDLAEFESLISSFQRR